MKQIDQLSIPNFREVHNQYQGFAYQHNLPSLIQNRTYKIEHSGHYSILPQHISVTSNTKVLTTPLIQRVVKAYLSI